MFNVGKVKSKKPEKRPWTLALILLGILSYFLSLGAWKDGEPVGTILFYFVIGLVLSYLAYSRIIIHFLNKRKSANIETMTSYEFEEYISNLFKKMGYTAQVTQKSDGNEGGDYGADVIVKKDGQTTVVQVKKWAPHNLVGAPDVRSVLGCLHTFNAEKAILVTTSDFTEQAKIQAKGAPIELWNNSHLLKLLNKHM